MHASSVVRGVLLASLVFLGAACNGVGPFGTQSASNEPSGLDPGPGDSPSAGGNPGDAASADRSSVAMDGEVSSVDSKTKSFRIAGGVKVQLEAATRLESDEECGCQDLEDVEEGLRANLTIRAEIRGRLEDGVLFASSVRFEVVRDGDEEEPEDDGDDGEEKEVEGFVASVDLLARICRTTDGEVIEIANDSIIDLTGDLPTLADVALSLTLGIRVRVEAQGKATATALVASKVKFVVDP